MYIPPEKQLRRFRIATGKRFFSKRFDFFIEKTGMQRYPMSIVANYKQEKKDKNKKKKKGGRVEWSSVKNVTKIF